MQASVCGCVCCSLLCRWCNIITSSCFTDSPSCRGAHLQHTPAAAYWWLTRDPFNDLWRCFPASCKSTPFPCGGWRCASVLCHNTPFIFPVLPHCISNRANIDLNRDCQTWCGPCLYRLNVKATIWPKSRKYTDFYRTLWKCMGGESVGWNNSSCSSWWASCDRCCEKTREDQSFWWLHPRMIALWPRLHRGLQWSLLLGQKHLWVANEPDFYPPRQGDHRSHKGNLWGRITINHTGCSDLFRELLYLHSSRLIGWSAQCSHSALPLCVIYRFTDWRLSCGPLLLNGVSNRTEAVWLINNGPQVPSALRMLLVQRWRGFNYKGGRGGGGRLLGCSHNPASVPQGPSQQLNEQPHRN